MSMISECEVGSYKAPYKRGCDYCGERKDVESVISIVRGEEHICFKCISDKLFEITGEKIKVRQIKELKADDRKLLFDRIKPYIKKINEKKVEEAKTNQFDSEKEKRERALAMIANLKKLRKIEEIIYEIEENLKEYKIELSKEEKIEIGGGLVLLQKKIGLISKESLRSIYSKYISFEQSEKLI